MTKVIFRRYVHGDIIALFPDVPWQTSTETFCSSYMRVGQHGGADLDGVIADTEPATPAEYAALLQELQSIGYTDLDIADTVASVWDMQCPECGRITMLDVEIQIWARLSVHGTDPDEAGCGHDHTWDTESACCCQSCGHSGFVRDFKTQPAT